MAQNSFQLVDTAARSVEKLDPVLVAHPRGGRGDRGQ